MTMLYKIGGGVVEEEHYGLALARVLDLPPQVLEVAEKVSRAIEEQAAAKRKSSKALAFAKRRKLVLGLREQLVLARDSPMEGDVLLSWLRKLQDEFVQRMELIENEVGSDNSEGIAVDEAESAPENRDVLRSENGSNTVASQD